jgi:hypothetical protein
MAGELVAPLIATPNGDMQMEVHCDKERRKDAMKNTHGDNHTKLKIRPRT